MVFFKGIDLRDKTRVAASFTEAKPEFINKYLYSGVDIAEIRIDKFASFEKDYVLNELNNFKEFPTIATIRSPKEDKYSIWDKSESYRLELFNALINKVDAVDIEYKSGIAEELVKNIKLAHKTSIVSFHDFDITPHFVFLEEIIIKAKNMGADIVKIATKINNKDDLIRMAKLLIEHNDKNLIIIGMGDKGIITRVAFPALGSLLTFAHIGTSTAQGQLDYREMTDILGKL